MESMSLVSHVYQEACLSVTVEKLLVKQVEECNDADAGIIGMIAVYGKFVWVE
ncbi:MAG: hypothetical protein ABIR84_02660 [Candidatus Nitrotoga sp.]